MTRARREIPNIRDMPPFVAAYALTAPGPFDRAAEGALYDGIDALGPAGLEVPFFGDALHRHDEGWLLSRLSPGRGVVITALPGTMERMKEDPRFGLASADPDGRRRALGFMEAARRAVERVNAALGRRAVVAVEVHSAPRPAPSPERFADSLRELAGWGWEGAGLWVEHCDAARPDGGHDKGFLSLEWDLAAARAAGAGVSLNWGRSAVEGRGPDLPLAHVREARAAGLLRALFLSGATADHPDYGRWRDAHAPFSTEVPASVLTPEAGRAAVAAAGDAVVGVKVQPLPASVGTAARLAVLRGALAALGL